MYKLMHTLHLFQSLRLQNFVHELIEPFLCYLLLHYSVNETVNKHSRGEWPLPILLNIINLFILICCSGGFQFLYIYVVR